MIQVVTTIEVVPGYLNDFLQFLQETVPTVKAEEGCLGYEPMVDIDSGMSSQGELRKNTVILLESWQNMGSLHAHFAAPHMTNFRNMAKRYVHAIKHQVLQPALASCQLEKLS